MSQTLVSEYKQLNMGHEWKDITNILDCKFFVKKSIWVKWNRPELLCVKINSDGSCLEGQCGGGGIIRDNDESDSKVLVDSVNNCHSTPWRIMDDVNEIIRLKELAGFSMVQCFREANKVADKLANLSHGISQNQMFQSYEELPLKVKGLLRLDRLGLPNLRTTNKKKAEITYDPS
ncbi:hypothetical protein RDI58_024289 [Solanum bulbocastanum]|uniref:RNase H type-1 domain-containing protein n=1 Tax=Solanum bulbocastanum TaxID=147425 RepID=A0AAN8T2U2_SOLBU